MMLLPTLLPWILLAFVVALVLNAWRLLRGPAATDRLLALDTLYVNSLALLVVYGLWRETRVYFEAVLLIALFGFVSTAALAQTLGRGRTAD